MKEPEIHVVAAVILRHGGVFLSTRPAVPPPDNWEFPGGKVEPGETLAQAVKRELREECGVAVTVFDELHTERIAGKERTLVLHFLRCLLGDGETPVPREGQTFRVVPLTEIERAGLLTADLRFAAKLRLMA